jgi:hypothetical protein
MEEKKIQGNYQSIFELDFVNIETIKIKILKRKIFKIEKILKKEYRIPYHLQNIHSMSEIEDQISQKSR